MNLRRKSNSSGSSKLSSDRRRPERRGGLTERSNTQLTGSAQRQPRSSSARLHVTQSARQARSRISSSSADRRGLQRTGLAARRTGSSSRPRSVAARKATHRAPWRLALAAMLLCVCLGFGVYFGLMHLPFFTIENIEIESGSQLSEEQVRLLAKVSVGDNLFRLDKKGIQARLSQNPWVEEVEITSKLPHTLHIKVKEKKVPAIVVLKGGQEAWYISDAGDWVQPLALQLTNPEVSLESQKNEPKQEDEAELEIASNPGKSQQGAQNKKTQGKDKGKDKDTNKNKVEGSKSKDETEDTAKGTAEGVSLETPMQTALALQNTLLGQAAKKARDEGRVLIYGVDDSLAPQAGERVPDGGVAASLQYLREFSANLAPQITQMTCPNKSSVMALLENGVQVSLGVPKNKDEISLKESVILSLLEQHAGEITYINVRVPAQPAWRGLNLKSSQVKDQQKSQ